ncbi:yleB [Wigglesworthia glossinidia endosymbiont of Glossina brevipalpis]|uniref:YleB protein n=1 Tax=Wigglesworthia glossinidia brevipalpis TaxID=36870 RepID=Q8D280_WIGBR|nr:yleB [Wigglesworthia glossinidia endosymbiont of Glossina brevipalpis]
MKKFFDIVIIGSGILGKSLSIKLAKHGFLIKLIELENKKSFSYDEIPDFKILALNYSTIKFLYDIDVWNKIDLKFCTKYKYIETWENSFFPVKFCSDSIDLSGLGYIIENHRLNKALIETENKYKKFIIKNSIGIRNMYYDDIKKVWKIILNNGKYIFSNLIIGADGKNSWVRKKSGIPFIKFNYSQSCMLFIVKIRTKKNYTVWQSIDLNGPKAYLPLYDDWALLIWYDLTEYLHEINNMSFNLIEKLIMSKFPKRLGPVTLHKKEIVPLTFLYGYQYVKQGLALLGDAVHTIHPLAGQGGNLGFRDVKQLSDVLIESKCTKKNWYELNTLKKYENNCKTYNTIMQFNIDLFRLLFSNDIWIIKKIRNLALHSVECSNLIKKFIIKYASGLF